MVDISFIFITVGRIFFQKSNPKLVYVPPESGGSATQLRIGVGGPRSVGGRRWKCVVFVLLEGPRVALGLGSLGADACFFTLLRVFAK